MFAELPQNVLCLALPVLGLRKKGFFAAGQYNDNEDNLSDNARSMCSLDILLQLWTIALRKEETIAVDQMSFPRRYYFASLTLGSHYLCTKVNTKI